MHRSTKWLAVGASLAGVLVLSTPAQAASPSFKVKPFEFVGTEAECGEGNAGNPDGVTSEWQRGEGLKDSKDRFALFLEKDVQENCAAAGATIQGVGGITLDSLGFKLRDGSYCGAGAPRMNVTLENDQTFFFGCASGVDTSGTAAAAQKFTEDDFTVVSFDDADASPQMSGNVWPGFGTAEVKRISIIMDEGGSAYLDDIKVNETVIGRPGKVKAPKPPKAPKAPESESATP